MAPRNRLRPLEARRALRALFANPDDTPQAFRVVAALSGGSGKRLLGRFRRSPDGARILREKRQLLGTLRDREALRAMPEGSLADALLHYFSTEQISSDGLVAASEAGVGAAPPAEIDDDELLLMLRLRDLHDIFHVLTGYGRDVRGEAAVLAFTLAQTWNTGLAYLVFSILFRAGIRSEMGQLIRQGLRRGRRATWLLDRDWEELLAQPLDRLRNTYRIGDPPAYEPVRSSGAPVLAD